MSQRPNIQPSTHIYNQLGNKRRQIAWIARLRTGHCSLNQYLERFNIIDDANCDCGQGKETVKHFLLICSKYEKERDKLRKEVGQHCHKSRVQALCGLKQSLFVRRSLVLITSW